MRATLAMALHFHQPVGNFDDIMDRACDKCYVPFLKTLRSYPSIRMTLHFTGCLLEWAEKNRPEILGYIREMASSGQAEIMTGGFYEPILISISPGDRVRQIGMLTEYVRKRFLHEPRGAWVAERVWEPGLAGAFSDAGVKYVILDDTHFLYAGVPKEDTYGYYVTEDNGKTVSVFPSDKTLRYHIPFKMPDECVGHIRSVAERKKDPLFVYGDDGEKFGEWPGTYKWVFEEKWLKNFFDELMKNSSWLVTAKLSDCLEDRPSTGRVYLPASSYEEMLEWSLPADSQQYMEDVLDDIKRSGKEEYYKPFVRGGFWRNFFTKYPESNLMNKKMIYVSKKLDAVRDNGGDISGIAEAEKELFMGQCNCAYWHGVFGGLYLYHLRNSLHSHIIRAEAVIDSMTHGRKQYYGADVLDIDADGCDEVVMGNRDISMIIAPSAGGVLKSLDSKACCQNFINTLSRKKEAYHRRILKKIEQQRSGSQQNGVKTIHDGIQTADPALKEHMAYDRYGRYSFMDRFLRSDVRMEDLSACCYTEEGDFLNGVYSHGLNRDRNGVELVMRKDGHVSGVPVTMVKSFRIPRKGAEVRTIYGIKNTGNVVMDTVFAPELNLRMPFADSDRYCLSIGESGKKYRLTDKVNIPRAEKIEIRDTAGGAGTDITVILGARCGIWHYPVKTVSQSEKAYELNYQGSAVIARYPIVLGPGEEVKIEITVVIDARRN